MHSSFATEFDDLAHEAFADAGMGAGTGSYLAPDADPADVVTGVRIYIDQESQTAGEYGPVFAKRVIITLINADVPNPSVGALVTLGSDRWLLRRLEASDSNSTSWVVEVAP
jgi:hypothetical protein